MLIYIAILLTNGFELNTHVRELLHPCRSYTQVSSKLTLLPPSFDPYGTGYDLPPESCIQENGTLAPTQLL